MARCGCSNQTCSCKVIPGDNIKITGVGTTAAPYKVSGIPTVLTVRDSVSIDMVLTGEGTEDSPYLLGADLATEPTGGGSVPAGTVTDFAGDTPPIGWLMCNGQAVARVEFSRLFEVIQTKYGVGDGVNTFNVPDARSRVTVGAGQSAGQSNRVLAAKGGSQDAIAVTHSHSHSHVINAGGVDHNHSGTTASANRDHSHSGTTNNEGQTHDHGVNVRWATGASGTGTRVTDVGQITGSPGDTGGTGHTGTQGALHSHTFGTSGHSITHEHGFTTNTASAFSHNHTSVTDATSAGTSGTDANMPPWIAFNKIIKT